MLKEMAFKGAFTNGTLKGLHAAVIANCKSIILGPEEFTQNCIIITNWDVYAIRHYERTLCHKQDTDNFVHQYDVSNASL